MEWTKYMFKTNTIINNLIIIFIKLDLQTNILLNI